MNIRSIQGSSAQPEFRIADVSRTRNDLCHHRADLLKRGADGFVSSANNPLQNLAAMLHCRRSQTHCAGLTARLLCLTTELRLAAPPSHFHLAVLFNHFHSWSGLRASYIFERSVAYERSHIGLEVISSGNSSWAADSSCERLSVNRFLSAYRAASMMLRTSSSIALASSLNTAAKR